MDDNFYESNMTSADSSGLVSKAFDFVIRTPLALMVTIILLPLLIVIATRLLSERPSKKVSEKGGRTVRMLPYWLPVIGHGIQLLRDPVKLMTQARDLSPHGIFALNLGATTNNIITDPGLVKSVMQKKESAIQFYPISWAICEKFFGFPKSSKPKYDEVWKELMSYTSYLMTEPHLSNMLRGTIRGLEENIPQMISFMDSEIDQQPWERWANASYISDTETELDLMSLMRDMMGHAAVPGLFGRALMEKYPNLLHDVYNMDEGLYFFLTGLPIWTPWPGVMKAHIARSNLWKAMDDHQRALDATVDKQPVDPTWDDFDDVSEFILKRHGCFKRNGFDIKERGDLSILWALTVNANLFVFWHILRIISTPGLVERIRAEIVPYIKITKPESIGKISEAPKLTIHHEGLAQKCPLLRSSYIEALRLSSQPWSIRQVAEDILIFGDKHAADPVFYAMHKGESIMIPHDVHMKDPKYFKDPEKFEPERFIVHNEDGSVSTDMGTARPYGGGPSMCKGRIFAERECLSLVAGVLMMWDFEPADKKAGWVIPKQKKTTAVSLPVHDVRVRVKRRRFEWED